MNEREFDAVLRRALMDAAVEELRPVLEGADAPDIQWSPRHQRRMARLLRDPFGTAKRLSRTAWKKVLQTAACIVLATAVALGGVLAVSPEARAKVWGLVGQWLETNTAYQFQGDGNEYDMDVTWRPTYLPEGYTEIEAEGANGDWRITYADADGNLMYLDYTPIQAGTGFYVDNEHSDFRRVTMNDGLGDLYESNTAGKNSFLLWSHKDGGTAFRVTAKLSGEELIKMAQSVAITG